MEYKKLETPPSEFWDGFHSTRRVSPRGASFFPLDGKETKGSPGEDSHRRRKQVPSGSSSFSPGPPFTGDTPIPSCNISGAQNMVPGMIPPGPLGPGAAQNFGLCHFTAAPRFDQPWQRVRDRGCAGRGRSHGAGTGGHRGPPLRGNRENVLQQGTGGHRGSPALCGP